MAPKVGRLGLVYLQGAGGSAQLLGTASSWSFRMDTDLIEISVFGASWKSWLPLPVKWEGTINGICDDTDTLPFDAVTNAITAGGYQPRSILMYPDRTNTSHWYQGQVWPKLSVTFDVSQVVARYVLDFTGDGALYYQ